MELPEEVSTGGGGMTARKGRSLRQESRDILLCNAPLRTALPLSGPNPPVTAQEQLAHHWTLCIRSLHRDFQSWDLTLTILLDGHSITGRRRDI